MNDTNERAGSPRSGRWIRIALFASLMINLLLVGAIAGRYWAHGGHFGKGHGDRNAFVSSIAEPRRGEIVKLLEANREKLRPLRDEVRKLRGEARKTMTAEPFDGTAVRAAVERVDVARARMRGQMIDDLVDMMGKLTAEERSAFHKQHRFKRGRDKRHDMD